jgi:hypothetical protein
MESWNFRLESRLIPAIRDGVFAPSLACRIGNPRQPRCGASCTVHRPGNRRKQGTCRMSGFQLKRFSHEHDCNALPAAIVAGKPYRRLLAKKNAAASPLLLLRDPQPVAVSTDKEQRYRRIENAWIGTSWQPARQAARLDFTLMSRSRLRAACSLTLNVAKKAFRRDNALFLPDSHFSLLFRKPPATGGALTWRAKP